MARERDQERERKLPVRREERAPAQSEELLGSPFSMMRRMREEMDRMFESFGLGSMLAPSERRAGMQAAGAWTPACDIWETDNEVKVRCDLPGVDPQDIEILTTDEALHIRAQVKKEEEVERRGFYRSERRYGSFERRFDLPVSVKSDQAKASFRHGTVEITLPKSEEEKQKMKKIPVETGEEEHSGTEGGARGKTQE